MSGSSMRRFWDDRAAEDPFYFVDNRQPYRRPDPEEFWAAGERDLDRLLNAVGAEIRPGDDILEIGCGIGRLTRTLARRGRSVRALDVSPRMLELAQEHSRGFENVHWLLGDGESLAGIDSASVDACISHVVFQHIPDPRITLGYVTEMGRVLRPGGWSAFQVSGDHRLHRPRLGLGALGVLARGVSGRGPRGQAHPAWLGSAVELDDLRATAQDAGMTLERVVAPGTQMCCVLLRRGS